MSTRPIAKAAPKLLTKEEAAQRMGKSPHTLTYWVQTGQGPRSARIGRRRYWLESDCDEWIEAQFDRAAG